MCALIYKSMLPSSPGKGFKGETSIYSLEEFNNTPQEDVS